MKLFRKLLYALFPRDMFQQGINPAGVFISFISPKQFFSVIVRRIVENYKINLFDISLDPYEVKIGFGEQPAVHVKDMDVYYAYAVAANLNGWTFYAPSSIAMATTLVMSMYIRPLINTRHHQYFTATMMSVYVLFLVFVSRIKVFPPALDEKARFQWFVDLFFSTLRVVMQQSGYRLNESLFAKYKEKLLQQIQLFFMLYYVLQHVQDMIGSPILSHRDFYDWLLYDHIKKSDSNVLFTDFVTHTETYVYSSTWWDVERQVFEAIMPADFLPRYMFADQFVMEISHYLVGALFDRDRLDACMHQFLQHVDASQEFIAIITDWKALKQSFFVGLKALTTQLHRVRHDHQVAKEIDKFMEELGEHDSLEGVQIPDVLKQESQLMERLLNFYLSFMGGGRVARGDTFAMRLWKKPLLNEIVWLYDVSSLKQDALGFYGWLLYTYSKNMFYYTYAFDSVKAGKEKFHLPYKSTLREVYSHMHIIKLFDEGFVATVLQDLLSKDLKIYMRDPAMLRMFRHVVLQDGLADSLSMDTQELVEQVYGSLCWLLEKGEMILWLIQAHTTPENVVALKDNLYTVDLWVWLSALRLMRSRDRPLSLVYGDMSIMGIVSVMRDTLFGFLLYVTFLRKHEHPNYTACATQELKRIYCTDVLNVGYDVANIFSEMLEDVMIRYAPLLEAWIAMDDNPKYFQIGYKNWVDYISLRDSGAVIQDVQWEDVLWLRWYLKHATYYNKRYLIPQRF
jgi:hypothetical protein